MFRRTFLAAAAAAAALTGPAFAQDYYQGKVIELIVPFDAGGPTDISARSFARFWETHIPGNPTIVVKNLPGGGGMRGFLTVYEASKPDGLTLYWGDWNPVGKVTGDPAFAGIEYDRVEYIGSAGAQSVNIIRKDAGNGIEKPSDIMNGTVVVGGTGPHRLPDLRLRLTLDLFGASYKYVPGYGGGAKVYAALRQGEVDMLSTTLGTYRSTYEPVFKESNEAMALWYFPTVDENGDVHANPDVTDIALMTDVYREVKGEEVSGVHWDALKWLSFVTGKTSFLTFAPVGTPPEVVDILRESYQQTKDDPGFIESEIQQSGVRSDFATISEGRAIIANYKKVSPEIVELLTRYVKGEN